MKKILIVSLLFLVMSCVGKTKLFSGYEYRILNIVAIDSTYLIYAERTDVSIPNTAIIKIASAKSPNTCKKRNVLRINNIYKLNVKSVFSSGIGLKSNLRGTDFNGTYISLKEDNVKHDLFVSDDIEGICYIKQPLK
jgi:hypothetical protein